MSNDKYEIARLRALIQNIQASPVSGGSGDITEVELSGAISNFPTRIEVSGAITASGGSGGIPASEISGAITASLVPYATLVGVSSSFTTPAQVSSSVTSAISSRPTRIEVSGAITGALINTPTRTEITGALNNYATLSGVSASFTTPAQVTSSLSSYATLSGVSASFTTPSQVSSSITSAISFRPTRTEVSGAITGAIVNFPSRTEISGVLTSSLTNFARKDQQNIFTVSQIISGNLNVTGTLSGAFVIGDGSGLTNLPSGSGGISASEVSGVLTSSLTNYARKDQQNYFSASQTISGNLYLSSSRASIQTNNLLDIIVSSSSTTGSQVLIDIKNNTGTAQLVGQATNHALIQAGSASEGYPFYLHADAGNKFIALEADDVSGTIFIGGTGIPSAIRVGSSGGRAIIIGNISASTLTTILGDVTFASGTITGINTGSSGGVSSIEVSGAITSSLNNYTTTIQVSGAITSSLTAYATLSGVSGSFTAPAQVSSSITSALSNRPIRAEVSGAITSSLIDYSPRTQVSGAITGALTAYWSGSQAAQQITGALTPYATLSGVSASFSTPSQVSGAITSATANRPTRVEVSGAITSALVPYATLSGISASFTTPAQVSSSITSAISNRPTRVEVSGAITSALVPYATLTGVSASFTTPAQVSSSITSAISNRPTRVEVSGAITGALLPYTTLTGVSASFTTPAQVSSSITSSLTNYARKDQQNIFTVSQIISGNLHVSGGSYSSFFVGDGSGLTNLSSSGVTSTQVSGAITASRDELIGFTLEPFYATYLEVTGVLTNYATSTNVSASFTTPAQVNSYITSAITDFSTETEISAAITSSRQEHQNYIDVTYATLTGVSASYSTLAGVSSSFVTPAQVSSSITSAVSLRPTRVEVSGAITASSHSPVTIGTANGLSLVGQQLSLAAASTSSNGVMTTGSQTIAGSKAFLNAVGAPGYAIEGASIGILGSDLLLMGDGAGAGTVIWSGNGDDAYSSSLFISDGRVYLTDDSGAQWVQFQNTTNNIEATGNLNVKSNAGMVNLIGDNHAYIQFYPYGSAAGRKLYTGFPASGSTDYYIANENNTGSIVLLPSTNMGVGIGSTVALGGPRLYVKSLNRWDTWSTQESGDVYIGNSSYGLKLGIADSGGGAGDAIIATEGGSNRLYIGAGTTEAHQKSITIQNGTSSIVQESWTAPTFNAGWANYGGGFQGVAYFKDANGIVHMRGLAQRTSGSNGTLFTLPSGYRPNATIILPARIDGTWGADEIRINSSGDVSMLYNAAGNHDVGFWSCDFDTRS